MAHMVERATYESRRRQLLDAVRTLREMPAQVVDALRAIAGEFNALSAVHSAGPDRAP